MAGAPTNAMFFEPVPGKSVLKFECLRAFFTLKGGLAKVITIYMLLQVKLFGK